MCGIAGLISPRLTNSVWESTLTHMKDAISYRGPDDSGVWFDAEKGCGLSHARLSIIDLTHEGHQPMASKSNRYMMVYNGEVYNYKELKKELSSLGCSFKSTSDTEVILEAIDFWGVDTTIPKLIGMFAIAVWDRQKLECHLIRDRLGIKPLYYGQHKDLIVFASELKPFKKVPGFNLEINRDSIALLLKYNYIPTPFSIYKNVHKLPPGYHLKIKTRPQQILRPQPYWSAKNKIEQGQDSIFRSSTEDITQELETLLRDAVLKRMIADVPLGAFLSGGVDSSLVVALMQSQADKPVNTFSIGFHESSYNEANHAKTIAGHLGTNHTELYMTSQETLDVIPKLPAIYDEPFADVSQIPTYLVSKMAKDHVKVCLSGDGGDELFGGYNRYFWGKSIWKYVGWLPHGMRQQVSKGALKITPQAWDKIYKICGALLPRKARLNNMGDKIHKLAGVINSKGQMGLYQNLISFWSQPQEIVLGGSEMKTLVTDQSQWANISDKTQLMMYLDLVSYLPDDILTKLDRASMHVSLESRVPLLDHRLVEYAARTPLHMKIKSNEGKWILKEILYKYVPKKLIDRPKMGFGVPIDQWLRGPLKAWAQDLLAESMLQKQGYFETSAIRTKLDEHLSGSRNWQYYLWSILMFQSWLEDNS
jgi:asparagine synthase (glutamine-hydrolysing)